MVIYNWIYCYCCCFVIIITIIIIFIIISFIKHSLQISMSCMKIMVSAAFWLFLKNVVLFCLPFSLQRLIFLVFFFLYLTVTEAILDWYRVWEAENTYVTCLQSTRSVLGVIQFDVTFNFLAFIVAHTSIQLQCFSCLAEAPYMII